MKEARKPEGIAKFPSTEEGVSDQAEGRCIQQLEGKACPKSQPEWRKIERFYFKYLPSLAGSQLPTVSIK